MERRVTCAIAGGGPAGMMLGVLLARAGVSVVVLEKHADFLRDFRGDTIHPSTLEVMHELGWLDDLLKRPNDQLRWLSATFSGRTIKVADFSHLPTKAKFIAMMPQWDFLNFLSEKGRELTGFELMMSSEADALLRASDGRVIGVLAHDRSQGNTTAPVRIQADLVVAADGRSSSLRAASGLKRETLGAPMDVMWFRLPREATDPRDTQGRFQPGRIVIMINRGNYWQCAFVIPKGDDAKVRARGLDAFRAELDAALPITSGRAAVLTDWQQVKLLTVAVDRLSTWWQPGLLCIGDAAHAMSPVGGVGINLAIQDAVAAANLLHQPLRDGTLRDDDLAAVQTRRFWPTRATQAIQIAVQNQMIAPALQPAEGGASIDPPFALRMIDRFPVLQRLPARLIGMGVRPEHVDQAILSAFR